MSHFVVMIIGHQDIDQALTPYWELDLGQEEASNDSRAEFEDTEQEFVIEYDEKLREMIIGEDGLLYFPWDHTFGLERVGLSGSKIGAPEHLERVQVSFWEMYDTFDKFMKEYHDEEPDTKTGRYGFWRNPKAKWDWFQLGGRWSGFLKLKNGQNGILGSRSLLDESPDDRKGRADIALFRDIDWDSMVNRELGERARRFWILHVVKKLGEELTNEDEKFMADFDPIPLEPQVFGAQYNNNIETYVAAMELTYVPWSVIDQNGKWFEHSEMGWWGMSTPNEEENKGRWNLGFFDRFLKDLPPETTISIVDCHI